MARKYRRKRNKIKKIGAKSKRSLSTRSKMNRFQKSNLSRSYTRSQTTSNSDLSREISKQSSSSIQTPRSSTPSRLIHSMAYSWIMVLVQSKRRSRKKRLKSLETSPEERQSQTEAIKLTITTGLNPKAIVEQDSSNEMMEPWKIEKLTLGSSASELEANRPELIELKRGNDTIKVTITSIEPKRTPKTLMMAIDEKKSLPKEIHSKVVRSEPKFNNKSINKIERKITDPPTIKIIKSNSMKSKPLHSIKGKHSPLIDAQKQSLSLLAKDRKAIEEIQQSAKHLEDSTSKSLKPSQSSALQSSKLPITLKDFNKKDFVESKSFDKSQMTTKSSQPKQLPLLATKPVILTEESKKLQPNSPYTKVFPSVKLEEMKPKTIIDSMPSPIKMDKTSPLLVQNHIDPQNFKKENKTNSTWTSKTWKSHDFHPLENDEVMKKLDLKSTTESKSIESLKKTPTLTSVISKSTEIDPKINILETRGENLIKSNDPKSQS